MQRRRIKRFIWIILVLWGLILVVGVLFSRSFQNAVVESLTEQADKQLLAEVHLRKSNIKFSLIKKFPLASVELRNVTVKIPTHVYLGKTKHADTLLYAEKLYLQLDLRSVFSKNYQLKKISINDGFLQFIQDQNGNSSLNIIKSSGNKNKFAANIASFTLNNVELYTYNSNSKFESATFIKKGTASGSFSGSDFSIQVKGSGSVHTLKSNGNNYLMRQQFAVDLAVSKNATSYEIHKGKISVGNIPMKIVGTIEHTKNPLVDLILSANNAPLKQIDENLLKSLIGQKGFIPKSGLIQLQTSIKGYIKKQTPKILVDFNISKGKIVDEKHDVTFQNIYLNGKALNWQGQKINSSIRAMVDSFYVSTDKSVQHGTLTIYNFNTLSIGLKTSGHLDVSDLNKFKSLNGINLNHGLVKNQLEIKGILPTKSQKANLAVKGRIGIEKIELTSDALPQSPIGLNGNLTLIDNTTYQLDTLEILTNLSDATINGKLYRKTANKPYHSFFGHVSCKTFIVDEFIQTRETNDPRSFQMPDSIQINGNIKIQNLNFRNYKPENIQGDIQYTPGKLRIDNLYAHSFSGTIKGSTSLTQNSNSSLTLRINSHLEKAQLEQIFNSFNNFNQDIIGAQHLNGKLSGHINYSSTWDQFLNLDIASIYAQGDLLLEEGELKNFDPLMGLSRFIEVEELKHIQFDNLSTTISIKNRKIILDQTHIASTAVTFDGSGIHDFDNKYSYRLQVGLSDILWKKARKKKADINEFGYVVDKDSDRTIVPFLITGKGTSFDVKYDKRTSRKSFKQKMEAEKKELRKLFKTDELSKVDSEPDGFEQQEKIQEEPGLKKNDSGVYEHKTKEFMLEWDDGEEEAEN